MTGLDQSTSGTLGDIDVYDARGTGAGWSVVVKASNFTSMDSSQGILAAAGFSIDSKPIVTTIAGNAKPQASMGPLDQPLQLLAAKTDTGMGLFQLRPSIRLNVPAETLAGTYETTVTVAIASGP